MSIDGSADNIEARLLSFVKNDDLTELIKFLNDSRNPALKNTHYDTTLEIQTESTSTRALWVLFKYVTHIHSQATDLKTPPYYIYDALGRRFTDVEVVISCYTLAKRIANKEEHISSDIEVILHRMRSYVAQTILDRSFSTMDRNTCGEISLQEVKFLPDFCFRFGNLGLPGEILAEIRWEVIYLLLTNWGQFNKTDEKGETILMEVVKEHDFDLQIVFELAKKRDVNLFLDHKNSKGKTILIQAVERYYVEKVKLLVENGASVSAQDNRGFTALHAAIYDSRSMKITSQTFFDRLSRKELKSRENFVEETLKSDNESEYQFDDNYIKHVKNIKEKIVEILLSSGSADVNAVDFTGKTPLDHAIELRTMVSKRAVEMLQSHGAVLTNKYSRDISCKAENDNYKGEGRGRTALHRLIIEQLSQNSYGEVGLTRAKEQLESESYENMLMKLKSQEEKFRILTEIKDEKGRTALHYAAMLLVSGDEYAVNLTKLLLNFKSSLTAIDDNRQTPLHFASDTSAYQWFVSNGADEETFDKWGQTPKSLFLLRRLMYERMEIIFQMYFNIPQILAEGQINLSLGNEPLSEPVRHIIKLSKEIRLWKVYNKINNSLQFLCRLREMNKKLQELVTRIADAVGQRDSRFKCKSVLVGSSEDGTKTDYPGDFDFDLDLIELSRCCEAVPSVTTSSGYVHLKKTMRNVDEETFVKLKFNDLFNEEQLLLTTKVNRMFKFLLLQVLHDPEFWKHEDLFELDVINKPRDIYDISDSLHSRIRLRMIHPIEDQNGDHLFFDTVLLDIVSSIRAPGSCIEDALTGGIRGEGNNTCEYNLVFDSSQRFCPWVPFRDTYARVSFGLSETNRIKNCPSILKTAYVVAKMVSRCFKPAAHSYNLKTCLLYCIEAFETTKSANGFCDVNGSITSTNLYFWVERILFCDAEFCNLDFIPCYFMSSLSIPTSRYLKYIHMNEITRWNYSPLDLHEHGIYTEICSDDFDTDISRPFPQPLWEDFNRDSFMKKLSKRVVDTWTMENQQAEFLQQLRSFIICD